MLYLVASGGAVGLVLAALVWYYRRRAILAEATAAQSGNEAAAAEADSRERSLAEDQRNAALVDGWKTRMDSAKENKDAQKALDAWNAIPRDGVRPKDGDGH